MLLSKKTPVDLPARQPDLQALHKKPENLDYNDFRLFLEYLLMEKLEPRTINVYIATLKQFVYFIQNKIWNKYEITFMKYDKTLPKVPSLPQAEMIVNACEALIETAKAGLSSFNFTPHSCRHCHEKQP